MVPHTGMGSHDRFLRVQPKFGLHFYGEALPPMGCTMLYWEVSRSLGRLIYFSSVRTEPRGLPGTSPYLAVGHGTGAPQNRPTQKLNPRVVSGAPFGTT